MNMIPPECSCEKPRFANKPCPIHGVIGKAAYERLEALERSSALTEKTLSPGLKDLLDMPLFSKRKAIADLCEKWCKQHHVPVCPQNIILAALKMKLLQIKDHD